MATVKIKDLKKDDLIKSYEIFKDEKWHFVLNVGPGTHDSDVYLALEDYGSGQFNKNREVERK